MTSLVDAALEELARRRRRDLARRARQHGPNAARQAGAAARRAMLARRWRPADTAGRAIRQAILGHPGESLSQIARRAGTTKAAVAARLSREQRKAGL